MKGSLVPRGAIVKASGVAKSMWNTTLTARIFEDEETAITSLRTGKIQQGTCIIIRNEGTKGGLGMREILGATSAVMGAGLGENCALVTDDCFSGVTHGSANWLRNAGGGKRRSNRNALLLVLVEFMSASPPITDVFLAGGKDPLIAINGSRKCFDYLRAE